MKTYKGCKIMIETRLEPNGLTTSTASIFKDAILVGMSFAVKGKEDIILKAKSKIDKLYSI